MGKNEWLLLLLTGVLLLVILVPAQRQGEERRRLPNTYDHTQTEDETISEEQKLEQLLERMDGVGTCRVMLTEAAGDFTFAGDRQAQIEGALIVCEGGDRPEIIARIHQAVMSLFGLSEHKITVVKMRMQEE